MPYLRCQYNLAGTKPRILYYTCLTFFAHERAFRSYTSAQLQATSSLHFAYMKCDGCKWNKCTKGITLLSQRGALRFALFYTYSRSSNVAMRVTRTDLHLSCYLSTCRHVDMCEMPNLKSFNIIQRFMSQLKLCNYVCAAG